MEELLPTSTFEVTDPLAHDQGWAEAHDRVGDGQDAQVIHGWSGVSGVPLHHQPFLVTQVRARLAM